MNVELKNGKITAQLDSQGAYVNTLDFDGTHVFFPAKSIDYTGEVKLRGGMHVCAPNFGPDTIYDELPVHGFAREMDWAVEERESDFAKFILTGIDRYKDVKFTISYRLLEDRLVTELIIENSSEEDQLFNPAFHPYFYSKDGFVEIENFEVEKEQMPGCLYDENHNQTFKTSELDIEIIGHQGVEVYTIWTDYKDDYVCVEPTYNAKSFTDEDKEPLTLKVGETFIQKFEIVVK